MRFVSALTILLLLGMTVRLGTSWIRSSDLTADNDGYLAHAEMVVRGEGFAGPFTHQPTAFRPPAYPIAIAGLRKAGLGDATSVAVINGLCSIVIICLTWKLGHQLGLPRVAIVFATTISTFDPLLLRYSLLPMTEVPAAAILLAAVTALKAGELRILSPDNDDISRHDIGLLILSGILFGLGSLVRPVILVSCAMLVAWRIVCSLKENAAFRRQLMTAAIPAAAALISVSPWIIRNAVQFHKFIPATTHGGYTLALGNNSEFYRDVIDGEVGFPWPGPQLDAWQKRMILRAYSQGVPIGNESAMDKWHYDLAFTAIQQQPASFLKACLLRLGRFCAITPGDGDTLPGIVFALTAAWYVVIAMGVVAAIGRSIFNACRSGMLQAGHGNSDGKSLADLWFVILSFMLLHSVYWTDTRMRAPVMPMICLIAASGLCCVQRRLFRHFASKHSAEPTT